MKEVIFSLGVFILIYLFYLTTVIIRKKKLEKFMKGTEITFLKKRYNLTLKEVNLKFLSHFIALTNSFIISITILCVSLIKNYVLKLMVAFVVLLPLTLICYHIIGLILKRKER